MLYEKLRRSVLFVLFAVIISGCATQKQWNRIGSPGDFMDRNRDANVAYACPSLFVQIENVSNVVIGIFGLVGGIAENIHAKAVNEKALEKLLDVGVREFTRDEIAKLFPPLLENNNRLVAKKTEYLPPDPVEMKKVVSALPAEDELFTVDSWLRFYSSVDGIVMQFGMELNFLSTGPRRSVIWREAYFSESNPLSKDLIKDDGQLVKSEIRAAIEDILPWIEQDFSSIGTQGLKVVHIKYNSGVKEDGYLIYESEDKIVIKKTGGMTRIVPRAYVKKMKIL